MKAAETLEGAVGYGMDNMRVNRAREQDRLVSAKTLVA